ncbi:LemA family protein [Megalodesulfovibrio gigas]|uniref:Putative LemA family protein n=1 Tax=Megalodesulfovibrio gigas (strain ATCC 19364 / DSM 1382 / NCIMB 9332 / VKM B-1759) TaxID=1121448 RepID=T2GEU6_MEGG1|nr:LemA family protein [Megalodesulfovibrio gigas]AGW14818.1 putative LemA family protein [Megalodesulfovibrio gigas DSM 1382 = ATCC 19364]
MVYVLGFLAILVLAALYGVAIYNGLVRSRNMVEEAFSGMDVQLKKRSDLIPNLVETVKGYAAHEREVLDAVTQWRAHAQQAQQHHSREAQAASEGMLGQALGRLFAVAENYPQLKADANFRELQTALAQVEDDLQNARRYYNGAVRNLNIKVQSFPSNLVAGMFGFARGTFFELEDPADRATPRVRF